MMLSTDQRSLMRRSFVLNPAVINFLLNGLIAWLIYGRTPIILLPTLTIDTLLTCFLIPFLTCLIVVPIVWQLVRQGDITAVAWLRTDFWWLRWLPNGKWARALAVGLATAILGTLIIVGLLSLLGIGSMAGSAFVWFKTTYAVILAALVTPLLALASLADASDAVVHDPEAAAVAIPVAQLPPGTSASNHRQAMQQDMIGYVEHVATQGSLVRIPLFGPVYGYFLNDPDLIRAVLVTQADHFHKPSNVKNAARSMRIENVFTTDGEVWQTLRKVMQPAFHNRRINQYAGVMASYSETMVDSWQDGAQREIPAEMKDLTLGITTRALFGTDMRGEEAATAIVRFIELFYGRISSLPVPGWLPTSANRGMRQQLDIIEAWLSPMIAERKAQDEPSDDVLSLLIEAQKADNSGILTDHQVRTEVMNLFAAGYEVVAHTLAFTLYLVAQHPQVEARILAELDAELGGKVLSLESAARLNYLDLVIKESMRLLPVTTVLTRQTAAPVKLAGYTLPKNRLIIFAPWTLHRDAHHFPQPLAFKPERFDPQNGQSIPKYAYLPFGGGARICLGNSFALLQMKINLATIWQHAHLEIAPGYQFEPHFAFNTRPKYGLPMIVTRRQA
ncbi:MAG TPA: cytochrome P450 [Anaerolineae bacterium]|nr:cytochrome P450 [Anaerolineae bacterium]